jgi:hypothetical protein
VDVIEVHPGSEFSDATRLDIHTVGGEAYGLWQRLKLDWSSPLSGMIGVGVLAGLPLVARRRAA